MEIAKDGSITSPADDIPGLSFRGKNEGDAQQGGDPIAEMDRHSKAAQVKSRREKMMQFHERTQIRAQPSAAA